jgi:hypothetical protein
MQVLAEHAYQDRRDGNDADGAVWAVLEAPRPDERFRTIETQSSTERAAWQGLASAGLD